MICRFALAILALTIAAASSAEYRIVVKGESEIPPTQRFAVLVHDSENLDLYESAARAACRQKPDCVVHFVREGGALYLDGSNIQSPIDKYELESIRNRTIALWYSDRPEVVFDCAWFGSARDQGRRCIGDPG